LPLQKAKDDVNGAEEGEEEKPKKTAAPPKKAAAAEKKVAEKKAPSKKRAPKKVPSLFIFTLTTMPDIHYRMQKSLARTLLRRSMKSELMKMNLRSLKLRSERYVRRRDQPPSHHRPVTANCAEDCRHQACIEERKAGFGSCQEGQAN
jgi:hypothetical protein